MDSAYAMGYTASGPDIESYRPGNSKIYGVSFEDFTTRWLKEDDLDINDVWNGDETEDELEINDAWNGDETESE